MHIAHVGIPATPPTSPNVPHNPPVNGPVLATFSYVIRSPHDMAHFGVIDAHAWPQATQLPHGSSFSDAVAAAQQIAARASRDQLHHVPINQAVGIMQSASGAYSLAPLGGAHRERTGPLFVDGRFFDAAALSLQIVRTTSDLVAIVGAQRVLDLRETGSATVIAPPRH